MFVQKQINGTFAYSKQIASTILLLRQIGKKPLIALEEASTIAECQAKF